jgi:hypothetical protein
MQAVKGLVFESQPAMAVASIAPRQENIFPVVKLANMVSGRFFMAAIATASVDATAPLAPAISKRSGRDVERLVMVID